MGMFILRSTADKLMLEDFCTKNCEGVWSIGVNLSSGTPESILTFSTEDDLVLCQLAFNTESIPLAKIAEPSFTVEELEEEPEAIENTRSYVIGNRDWRRTGEDEEFVEEVIEWCANNVQEILISRESYGKAIIGLADDEDKITFLLRWESHPFVTLASSYQWPAAEDVG